MCGRYRLSRRKQIIEEHFDTISGDDTTFHEKKRIFLPATGCPAGEEVAGCVVRGDRRSAGEMLGASLTGPQQLDAPLRKSDRRQLKLLATTSEFGTRTQGGTEVQLPGDAGTTTWNAPINPGVVLSVSLATVS